MSRTLLLAATISLAFAPFGAVAMAQSDQANLDVPAPRLPADAATRAAYERSDALSRSMFWANEMAINPMDSVAGVKLSQALRELGQYDRAAETAEGVLTVQPNNVDAMMEIGRAHIARGQAFYGISALERARDANRRDWRPLSLLGVAYQQVRRFDDAQAAWQSALAISPDQPEVLNNMAMALMGSGQMVEAEGLLRRAVAHPQASLQIRQNLALSLGLQGRTQEAETLLRRELPPEAVDQNLQWLSQRTQGASASQPAVTPATAPVSPTARSWDSLTR